MLPPLDAKKNSVCSIFCCSLFFRRLTSQLPAQAGWSRERRGAAGWAGAGLLVGVLHWSPPRGEGAAGSFGATQGICLWQRGVFKWETEVRLKELLSPLRGSWTLFWGCLQVGHIQPVPAETKGAKSGKIHPRASGSASPGFVASHMGPPRKRRQVRRAGGGGRSATPSQSSVDDSNP